MGFAGRALAFLPAMLAPIGTVIAGIAASIAAITAPVWIVIGVVAAAVAGLALAIYNYWVPVSQFVAGFASVVGDAIGNVVAAVTSLGGRIVSAVGSWATTKLIDFAAWLGIDEATVQRTLAAAITILGAPINAIVTMFREIPARVGNWLADIFTMNSYSAADVQGFRDAGERAGRALVDAIESALTGATTWTVGLLASVRSMAPAMLTAGGELAQKMWDGIRVKLDEMVAWFSGLPSRIVAAIGSIDLSSLIEWPSPPAWLRRLWVGDEEATVNVVPADDAAGAGAAGTSAEPSTKGRGSAAALDAAVLPEPSTEGWGSAAARGIADFVRSISAEGSQAQAEADRIGTGVESALSVTARPVVETSGLERAIALANNLREKLLGLPSTTVKAGTGAAIAGARAAGGPVQANGTYLVGEEGPELVTFGRDGFVHNAVKTVAMLRAATLAGAGVALPAAAASLPSLPEIALPAVPQVEQTQSVRSGGEGRSRERPAVALNVERGAIVVHAAPGQSAEQIAAETERRLNARVAALSRGAFSDGAN